MTFCHSIFEKKVIKGVAFIFEQPSYQQVTLAGSFYMFSQVFFSLAKLLNIYDIKHLSFRVAFHER